MPKKEGPSITKEGSSITKFIGPILTICALIVGFSVTWGVIQTRVAANMMTISEIKSKLNAQEERVRDIELKAVSTSEQLSQIKATLDEIKDDVKAIRSQPR